MSMKNIFLGCLLFLLPSIALQASTPPSSKGFKKLQAVYVAATKALGRVSSPQQLSPAISELEKLRNKYAADKAIASVLALSPETCPTSLQPAYRETLRLQADMKDAGKRLAMGGILQGGPQGAAFKSFTDAFRLDQGSEDPFSGQEGAPLETKEARDARMQWWRDGKFGMFIHYGLYSGLAGEVAGNKYEGCVEWIQMQSGLDSDRYAAEALPKFDPKEGKATEWVKLAKESGCAYVVLTSRHHEGFNMFDTKHSDFNVKKAKGIDIIQEYAKACDQYDIKAGYYVSLLDWGHPDYDPTGSGIAYPQGNYDAQKQGRRQFGHHERYKEYLFNVFDELTSNYKADLVWWDFSQPNFQGDKAWGATRLMRTLLEKNPKAIQNNRLYHSDNHLSEGGIKVTPTWKGDYSTAEQHIPATGIDGDWEACQTLNGTWGYSALNQKWKTSEALVRELVDAVSRGGNFLLNIGPEADGTIPAESVRLFKEIGAWMNVNGEAIYGTRANPFDVELPWGRVTRKGDDVVYLLVYEKPDSGLLQLPCTFSGDVRAELLQGGEQIPVSQNGEQGVTAFDIREVKMQHAATVIKVTGHRN